MVDVWLRYYQLSPNPASGEYPVVFYPRFHFHQRQIPFYQQQPTLLAYWPRVPPWALEVGYLPSFPSELPVAVVAYPWPCWVAPPVVVGACPSPCWVVPHVVACPWPRWVALPVVAEVSLLRVAAGVVVEAFRRLAVSPAVVVYPRVVEAEYRRQSDQTAPLSPFRPW